MELDGVAKHREAFYRLVGSMSDDDSLTERGEGTHEVCYLYLTRGCRNAQFWMLKMGYAGWRSRSAALTWTGSDATTGGRYCSLPTDFLRAYGSQRKSALTEADGERWGTEIGAFDDDFEGNYYYIRGDELWLARTAEPPTTLYLDYHYAHPEWNGSLADASIDFPMNARWLIVAEAADAAKEDNWLPGGKEMEVKIDRALRRARDEARDIVRRTKQPRQFQKARRFGNHWALVPLFLAGAGALDMHGSSCVSEYRLTDIHRVGDSPPTFTTMREPKENDQ